MLSAYQSQDKNLKVFKISRFAEVEDFILDKVRNDGRFLRIKTFADAVAVLMSNVILEIYKQSAASLQASDVWFDKRRQLDEWIEKFNARSTEKDECERKRKELSDELTQELSYDFSGNTSTNITLERTTTWGKYLFAASNLLVLIPGIGWGARIAIGVGSVLISFLFENKQEKIRKAKYAGASQQKSI